MALNEYGVNKVLDKISVEPSGDAFNSISLYPETGRPFNPMINAGAIASTSLIREKYPDDCFERILDVFSKYAGSELTLDDEVYESESRTGHRNRAIGYLMRNFNILESNVEGTLDAYFKQCSINVNCRQLSTILSFHSPNLQTAFSSLCETRIIQSSQRPFPLLFPKWNPRFL